MTAKHVHISLNIYNIKHIFLQTSVHNRQFDSFQSQIYKIARVKNKTHKILSLYRKRLSSRQMRQRRYRESRLNRFDSLPQFAVAYATAFHDLLISFWRLNGNCGKWPQSLRAQLRPQKRARALRVYLFRSFLIQMK